MATKIRLQRGGTTNRPYYRFVVATEQAARDGKFIEKIGTFDPLVAKDSPKRMTIKKDRIEYWLSVGAQPSEKVALLITKAGIANDNPTILKILKKRDKTIALKKVQLEAKKKAEAEASAKAAAEEAEAAKAEADKQAAEAAATAEAALATAETPAA